MNARPRRRSSLALLALAAALVLGMRAYQQRGLADERAPELDGKLLDGRALAAMQPSDRPRLVYFWASWCAVCRWSETAIDSIARDHAVITIALQSGGEAEVQAYLRERRLSYPVVNDPAGSIATRWGVRGVPAAFIVGADGMIRFREVGYTSEIGLRARLWLAR